MSADDQRTSAGRVVRLNTIGHLDPPQDDVPNAVLTVPDLTTSPLRADGLVPTMGLMVCLKAPTATGGAPATSDSVNGFLVTVWIRNPATRQWGKTAQFQAPYDVWFRTFDFNGGDLYFQLDGIGTDGNIDCHVVEL